MEACPELSIHVFLFLIVFERYKSYSPYDMLESIKKEVKGDLENAFLNLGKYTGKDIAR